MFECDLESLAICLDFERSHMLASQGKRALARPQLTSMLKIAGQPNKAKCALLDSVETMYRAMVYEALWNDKKKQVNRAYLQELLEILPRIQPLRYNRLIVRDAPR
jgi:hypothetical protein